MEYVFTAEQFEVDVLQADKPVLVDVWAPWCGPCLQMGPIVDELADELADRLKVGKLNIDEHGSIAERYHILSIPTFLVFNKGELVATLVGSMTKEMLKAEIVKHL